MQQALSHSQCCWSTFAGTYLSASTWPDYCLFGCTKPALDCRIARWFAVSHLPSLGRWKSMLQTDYSGYALAPGRAAVSDLAVRIGTGLLIAASDIWRLGIAFSDSSLWRLSAVHCTSEWSGLAGLGVCFVHRGFCFRENFPNSKLVPDLWAVKSCAHWKPHRRKIVGTVRLGRSWMPGLEVK